MGKIEYKTNREGKKECKIDRQEESKTVQIEKQEKTITRTTVTIRIKTPVTWSGGETGRNGRHQKVTEQRVWIKEMRFQTAPYTEKQHVTQRKENKRRQEKRRVKG